jgi:hypothetical protein
LRRHDRALPDAIALVMAAANPGASHRRPPATPRPSAFGIMPGASNQHRLGYRIRNKR